MKILAILLLAVTLVGCASIPVDPNISTLVASDERRQAAEHAHQEALASARAKAAEACAKSPDPAVCALGQVAMTLAAERGAPASAPANALAGYQRPESGFDKFLRGTQVVGGMVTGAGQIWAGVENNRESNRTTRYVAGVNADRELGTVQALAGLGAAIANQPPGIVVGGNLGDTYGNDFTGGNRTDVDNTGVIGDGNEQRQDSDNLDNVGNCVAGTGGNGGNGAAGAPGGNGAAGGNAGSGGDNANGTAGPGGDGAFGGNGGTGGQGGNGGNCTGGRP